MEILKLSNKMVSVPMQDGINPRNTEYYKEFLCGSICYSDYVFMCQLEGVSVVPKDDAIVELKEELYKVSEEIWRMDVSWDSFSDADYKKVHQLKKRMEAIEASLYGYTYYTIVYDLYSYGMFVKKDSFIKAFQDRNAADLYCKKRYKEYVIYDTSHEDLVAYKGGM